jgi:hypothetical protein
MAETGPLPRNVRKLDRLLCGSSFIIIEQSCKPRTANYRLFSMPEETHGAAEPVTNVVHRTLDSRAPVLGGLAHH